VAVKDPFPSIQLAAELDALIALFRDEGVRRFLEVGSKFGGTLFRVAQALPTGSRIVSVDLNRNGPSLRQCIETLRGRGYDAHLIAGDSTDPRIVNEARSLGPYDAVFIDADHRPDWVEADWLCYGPMARMVCFHDIGWRKPSPASPRPIGVPQVWNAIKQDYRHREILLDPNEAAYGIGVLWRT